MLIIKDLRETLSMLIREKRVGFNMCYEHTAPFGQLSLSSNLICAHLAQMGLILGIGKETKPITLYDSNLTALTNKRGFFSTSMAAIYQKQFNLVISNLHEQNYSRFHLLHKYFNQEAKENYYNKVRISMIDLTALTTTNPPLLLIQVFFQPCDIFPGFIYDLATIDVIIEQLRQKFPKCSVTTTLHIPLLRGNGDLSRILESGYSGFKEIIETEEAAELLRFEHQIRVNKLGILPSSLLPLCESSLNFLNLVKDKWRPINAD